jgi:uncharacterized protein (DUF736 family)
MEALMSDYDNTNRGAAFPPFDTQQMILQGKLNIEGIDDNMVLVKDVTKSGKTVIGVYQRIGTLFQNDKSAENQPDYTGPVELRMFNAEKRLAAWKKMKDGRPYLTMSVSDKQERQQESADAGLVNDDIPF